MAITFDAASNDTQTNPVSARTSLTWSHINAGNYLLVCMFFNVTTVTNVAITYNGISMTLLGTSVGAATMIVVFGLANPSIGTFTVSATWTTSAACSGIGVSYLGVGSISPTITTSSGTTSPSSVTAPATGLTVDFIGIYRSGSTTSPGATAVAPQTARVNHPFNGASNSFRIASSDSANDTNMQWTLTNQTSWEALSSVLLISASNFFLMF